MLEYGQFETLKDIKKNDTIYITYLETAQHNDLKLSWFWISAPQAAMYTTAPHMNLMNGVNSSEKTYVQFQGV